MDRFNNSSAGFRRCGWIPKIQKIIHLPRFRTEHGQLGKVWDYQDLFVLSEAVQDDVVLALNPVSQDHRLGVLEFRVRRFELGERQALLDGIQASALVLELPRHHQAGALRFGHYHRAAVPEPAPIHPPHLHTVGGDEHNLDDAGENQHTAWKRKFTAPESQSHGGQQGHGSRDNHRIDDVTERPAEPVTIEIQQVEADHGYHRDQDRKMLVRPEVLLDASPGGPTGCRTPAETRH